MIHLYRAERADRLIAALARVVGERVDDPFQPEVVAVPSRGIERWIAQELSTRLGVGAGRADGVCANVHFPFPGRVIGWALAAAGEVTAEDDPWHPARLVWHVLELLDVHLAEPWMAPLRVHLGGPDAAAGEPDLLRRGRRYGAARHIADLFDRYAVHRPEMLLSWVDAGAHAADRDTEWQPRLWTAVRDRLSVASPAERMIDAASALREGLDVPELPPRVSLFGLTALPASYLHVLSAIAATRDVHLFLLHPSPALWTRVAEQLGPGLARRPARDADPTRDAATHPLLGSWGRDAREMQLVITAAGAGVSDVHLPADKAATPRTLLARLQADVHADRMPGAGRAGGGAMQARLPLGALDDRRPRLDAGDRSVQVHACHGRTRQVEVLRDAILHLLAEDSSLEPRDIVVMCPDIEEFAPIIHAVFGAAAVLDDEEPPEGDPTHDPPRRRDGRLPDLRVRLADRSIRQTNPVLRVVAELLDLADGRLTASQVLGFASREPVRRRFRLDDTDLERLDAWVAQARIRWGVDADHRAGFGLPDVSANTWRAGLDRLLLGVAMPDEDDRLVGGTVPLDDVEGSDVGLAGHVAELIDRLTEALQALRGPNGLLGWQEAIRTATDLLTATTERDRWQRVQLHRILDDVVTEATTGESTTGVQLSLPEVRALLADRLRGRPSIANHRTGDLTFCTLVPMRSVPHRVVCLLGMDDGTFPRHTAGDGDDLIAADPLVGDRDARTEDRQLLLDALLAAEESLVVTYTGRDERTNERRPPAVPIGELLDVIDRMARSAQGGPAADQVLVEHPLQPFDARNFARDALVAGRVWGFDPVALAGARAKAQRQPYERAFLEQPLDTEDLDVVVLDELVRFFEHPTKAFLRARLGVALSRLTDQPSDAIPVELHPLDEYAVGDRLLAARLSGTDPARWVRAERARGVLPPGALADAVVADVTTTVDQLLDATGPQVDLTAPAELVEVDVGLPDGRRLVGTVGQRRGDVLLTLQYSRVRPKHRLASWLRLLAATAADPSRPLRAVTIGRCRKKSYAKNPKLVTVAALAAPDGGADRRRRWALDHLACLVDLYDRGQREPLPVYCLTSAAYAEAVHAGKDGVAAARSAWATEWSFAKEDRDPEHVAVLGPDASLEDLLRAPPCADEAGDGWAAEETTRFGRCARRLWDGLLAAEELEDC